MISELDRRQFVKVTAAAGATLTFGGFATADEQTRYLVTVEGPEAHDRIESAGFAVQNELADGLVVTAVGPSDAREDLEGVEGVETAARDFAVEFGDPITAEANDDEPAYWDIQWDKHVTDVERAHETATGEGSTVAVVDTGIDATHPDLQNVNTDLSASVIDGDLTTGDDEWVHWHGTHVAGIAAGQGEGIVGQAPDAELVSLRVFPEDRLFAFASDIMIALEYAADIGADAANVSLGTSPIPPEGNAGGIRAARERVVQNVVRQGTLVSASAGNSDANLQQGGYFTLTNSVAGALSVSATGPNDERTYYSNYGTNEIDVGAPGGGYETREKSERTDTPWPYPLNFVLSTYPDESYVWAGGTSMAAPQVAGAAALVREVAPDANARQVERAIKAGADLVDGESDADLGAGRLNAADAVDSA